MKHLKLFFALFAMLALNVGNAWGEEQTVKWTATSGALGNGIGSGTIKTGTYAWNYTRTLISGSSYTGWSSSCIQLGKNGGVENITFTTSAIPGTIKSVAVECSSYNNAHKVSIAVGGTTYLAATATAKWTTVGTKTGTGSSTGTINISFTGGTRALYIKSITVVYEETSSGGDEPVASLSATPTTIDFGTVYQGADVESKTVAVNFENLTGNVTYSGLSTPFTATGTVSNDGDKITIAANTATINEYSQTLTITSAADSKTAEVTVKMNVVEKPAPTGTFTLHTGALVEGDYVIVSTNSLKAEVNSDRLASLPVTISNDEIVDPDATTIWHIAKSGEYWTLYNANKAKYAASTGAKNKAALLDDATDDKALWSVTGTSTYEFVNKKNAASALNANLRYNKDNAENSRWACYSTSTGAALSLYRKAGTQYNVTVSATENGTVTASPTSAEKGTTITLTVTPADGYLLDALTVTDASSNPITVTDNKFTMPASDVTVTATFKENEKPAATLTLSKNGVEETFPGSWKQDDVVTLPSITSDCVKEFVGWSADQNCTTEPEYEAGDEYTLVATAQTLYAVYATAQGGGEVTSEDLFENNSTYNATNPATIDWTLSNVVSILQEQGTSTSAVNSSYDKDPRWYKSHVITITPSVNITKIVTKAQSNDYATALANSTYTNATATANGDIVTITPTTGNEKITIKMGAQARLYTLTVTYASAATYSDYSTTCTAAPKAEVNPAEVTATATGGNGTVSVTYENVNTANVAVALFNDEDCTEAFTAGWLTASLDGDKNIAYTVAATTLYTERKAYIQLTAPDAAAATDPAVVVIPVTQAGKDKVFASLAELVAADLTAGDEVTVTLNNDVIKSFYTITAGRAGVVFDVQKDGKDIKIFYNNQTTIGDWEVGGKLSGTLTNVKWSTYSNEWQLAPTANTWDWANLTYTAPATIASIAVTGTPTKTTYTDGETFDPTGLVATATYTDATNEDVTNLVSWTFDPATLTKGQTSVNVVALLNSVSSPAYEVTGLTVNDIPTKTVAEFIAAGGVRCYLEGIVSNIANATYGNFDLTDETSTIFVYGCLNAEGVAQKFAELGVKEGDKIKVIAETFTIYDSKNQATNVQYVSHIPAATIEIADITMEVGETTTIAATVTPEGAAVSYAIKAGSDDCITLNGAEITATTAGTATIVATIAETAEYLGVEKEISVTVSAPDTRNVAEKNSFASDETSGSLTPADIIYVAEKGGASTAPAIYNDGIRLYQISSGNTYGGYITLTAVKGCMIDQVEITTTDQYNTTTVAYSVDGNETLLGSASVAKLSKYSTPVGLNTESVNILNLGTTSSNRLEIASIKVYYTGEPLPDPELSWSQEEVVLAMGEEFNAPTLNNPYNVAGITYSSDNEDVATVTDGVITLVHGATGEAIITASFAGNEQYREAEVSCHIVVNEYEIDLGGTWQLITDVTDLQAGLEVIIANTTKMTMGEQKSNNRGAVTSEINSNILTPYEGTEVFTIEAGVEANTYAFKTPEGYLYAASSSSNYMRTQATNNANGSWKIEITEEGIATIIAQGDNSNNWMRYNANSTLFSCYASTSTQADVALYKRVPDYQRDVKKGFYGTICLPKASKKYAGASFYEIGDKDDVKVYLNEVKELVAGTPYIFLAEAERFIVYCTNDEVSTPTANNNGLIGTFTKIAPADENALTGMYLVRNNQLVKCGKGCGLEANRAYINLDAITENRNPMPGCRRLSMNVQGENAATGVDNITEDGFIAPAMEGIYDIMGRRLTEPTTTGFYIIDGKKVFVVK